MDGGWIGKHLTEARLYKSRTKENLRPYRRKAQHRHSWGFLQLSFCWTRWFWANLITAHVHFSTHRASTHSRTWNFPLGLSHFGLPFFSCECPLNFHPSCFCYEYYFTLHIWGLRLCQSNVYTEPQHWDTTVKPQLCQPPDVYIGITCFRYSNIRQVLLINKVFDPVWLIEQSRKCIVLWLEDQSHTLYLHSRCPYLGSNTCWQD